MLVGVQLLNPHNLEFMLRPFAYDTSRQSWPRWPRWVTDSPTFPGDGWEGGVDYNMSEVEEGHGVVEYSACPEFVDGTRRVFLNEAFFTISIRYMKNCSGIYSGTTLGGNVKVGIECSYNTDDGTLISAMPFGEVLTFRREIKVQEVTATSVTFVMDDYFDQPQWWEHWRNHESECTTFDREHGNVPIECDCTPRRQPESLLRSTVV